MRFFLTLMLSAAMAAPIMLLLTLLQQPVAFDRPASLHPPLAKFSAQPTHTRLMIELTELTEPLVYLPAAEELFVPSPEGGLASVLAANALFIAVADADLAALQDLFAAGASTDVYNAEGSTPLIEAIRSENKDVINAILEKGVDTNLALLEGGRTALSLALSQGDLELATRLLDAGADINQKNAVGDTVLIDVLRSRPVNYFAVDLLLSRQPTPKTSSPDLGAVDASGVSVREIVTASGDADLISLFKEDEGAAEDMDMFPIIDMKPFTTLAPPPEPTFPSIDSLAGVN